MAEFLHEGLLTRIVVFIPSMAPSGAAQPTATDEDDEEDNEENAADDDNNKICCGDYRFRWRKREELVEERCRGSDCVIV